LENLFANERRGVVFYFYFSFQQLFAQLLNALKQFGAKELVGCLVSFTPPSARVCTQDKAECLMWVAWRIVCSIITLKLYKAHSVLSERVGALCISRLKQRRQHLKFTFICARLYWVMV